MTRTTVVRVLLLVAALPGVVRAVTGKHPQFVGGAAGFRPPAVVGLKPAATLFQSEFLPAIDTQFVHAATMVELPNGDLAAAWYGGTDEVLPDVAIRLSVRDHSTGQWSKPRVIENREIVRSSLHMRVKSVGNPVLVADSHGLRMFFSIVMAGGWSGATICMTTSPDWGVQWTPAKHVVTSYLDAGMMVRGAAAAYDDGTTALPIYHQLSAKWAAVARVDAEGHVLNEWRIGDNRPLLQPWLVVQSPTEALALLRYSARMPFCVTIARTKDAARTWSDVAGTALVHRDSAVAGVLLDDDSLLAIYNNSAWDRRDLSIARSIDQGRRWSWPYPLVRDVTPDEKVRREYSYPYVLRTRDGIVHVLFTWQRTRIRHVMFNDAWARTEPKLAVMR
jgi:predicted neuraminidase